MKTNFYTTVPLFINGKKAGSVYVSWGVDVQTDDSGIELSPNFKSTILDISTNIADFNNENPKSFNHKGLIIPSDMEFNCEYHSYGNKLKLTRVEVFNPLDELKLYFIFNG